MIDDLRRQHHSQLQIDVEAGVGLASGQGSDPQMMIRWSDDAGHTYGNEHWVSIGAMGQYGQRAVVRRLGLVRDRVYEVSGSDPVKTVILNAYVDVVDGRH